MGAKTSVRSSRAIQFNAPPHVRGCVLLALSVMSAACRLDGASELIARRADVLFSGQPLNSEQGAHNVPVRTSVPSTQAPPRVEAPGTLDDYLHLGLCQSSALRAAFEEWSSDVERIAVAEGLSNPRLSWTEFLVDLETRTGPQHRRIGVTQALPWFGLLDARGDAAAQRAAAGWAQVERQRATLLAEIRSAHAEYAYLGERVGLAVRQLELLRGLEPVVQNRIQGGAPQRDLIQLQVEIGQLENKLASIDAATRAASARLAALVEWSGPTPLPMTEQVAVPAGGFDRAVLFERALELSPELSVDRSAVAVAEADARVARLVGRPDMTFGVQWFPTGDAIAPGVADSGDDPVAVSLSFGLPVWRARDSARNRAARHQARAANARLGSSVAMLRSELEALAFAAEDAARQTELYRDVLLPRAAQSLELVIAAYRSGDSTLLDVIDAERVELDLQDSYRRAVRDAVQSIARLEALVGGPLQ